MRLFSFGARLALLVSTVSIAATARAEHLNVPAASCEIYVEKLLATAGSHDSGSVKAVVRVPFLGNGEEIELVLGFYGHSDAHDLGNSPDCHWGPSYDDGTDRIYPATPVSDTQLGEYAFVFPAQSGSVVDECPGYGYSWVGAFFVQTNFKTYWVNPNLDMNAYFTFDARLYDSIDRRSGVFNYVSTNTDYLRYYNPLACTR